MKTQVISLGQHGIFGRYYYLKEFCNTTWFLDTAPEGGERIATINYPGNVANFPYHVCMASLALTADPCDPKDHYASLDEACTAILKEYTKG